MRNGPVGNGYKRLTRERRIAMFRLIFQIMLIGSMVGLGAVSLIDHRWKEFGLGFLYAIANTIIFIL